MAQRLLFSVHGIRTSGTWQDDLRAALRSRGRHYEPFRYGYFSLPRFLRNASRRKIIEQFHEWYVVHTAKFYKNPKIRNLRRPSVVAHSFGSYVIGECMLKYREVKFDKIILCGSILPREFDWLHLLGRNQVWRVRNEYGPNDYWSKIVSNFVPRTGDSGHSGFSLDSPCLTQEQFDYHAHSDYFRIGHTDQYWLPFLEDQSLNVALRHGVEIVRESDFVSMLNRTHEIDNECFGTLPTYQKLVIPRGLSTTWIRVNPDIYTFLIDQLGDRPIGYINAMPVQESVFRRITSGDIDDNEITDDNLTRFDVGGYIYLYVMAVVIDPAARRIGQGINQEALGLLMAGLENKLKHYWAKYQTKVSEIAGVGWTAEGRQLCEAVGMTQVGRDKNNFPTYSLRVSDAAYRRGPLSGLAYRLKTLYAPDDFQEISAA